MHFNPLLHNNAFRKYNIFENIIEKGGFARANAPFSIIFSKVFKTLCFQRCLKIENDVMI